MVNSWLLGLYIIIMLICIIGFYNLCAISKDDRVSNGYVGYLWLLTIGAVIGGILMFI